MLATLPHPDPSDSPAELARRLQRWRTLLRPGGFLIVTLTGDQPTTGARSLRGDVIAAAPAAGLRWHQQLLIVTRLPEAEPRAEALATQVDAALADGRHAQAHRTPLVFVTTEFPEAHHG